MTRLLIFTPTWIQPNGTDAIHPDCAAAIRAQEISGRVDWVVRNENLHPIGDAQNVTDHYIAAHAMFMAGDWDALLTVEHDNVLPDAAAAQRLLETPGDVVYAPYMLRHGSHVLSLWQYIGGRNLGQSLTLHPEELRAARAANIWRVSGVGHGCTLFRRHVLERIPFRGPDDGSRNSPDIPFAFDAQKAGFVSVARCDVPVVHIEGDLRLHPWERVPLTKYRANVTVNVLIDGQVTRLIEGQWYEMSDTQAIDLARVGFVNIPDDRFEVGPLAAKRETATAEPDVERAVTPPTKKRKAL